MEATHAMEHVLHAPTPKIGVHSRVYQDAVVRGTTMDRLPSFKKLILLLYVRLCVI